ncbi:MAG: DUF2239 family protein, partial [Brevundimonas sp.]
MGRAMSGDTHLAFVGERLLTRGALADVARAVRGSESAATVFDARTGGVVDLNLSGSEEDVAARYRVQTEPARGRPKLGVTAREVTLLPRHWDW